MYRRTSHPTAQPTDNEHGLMFPLSKYGRAFVEFAPHAPGPALDVGAAYGVSSLPALQAGAAVIANDISETELAVLAGKVPQALRSRLTLLPGRFPEDVDLGAQTIGAVEASHVLHFLDGQELESGCRKLFAWLKPGGRVFVVCFTPYHKFMERFIPVYEERVKRGDRWPGFIEDSTPYVLRQHMVPQRVHLMDDRVLSRVFRAAGFTVENVEMFPCPVDLEPREFFHLDGREWVGLIARKDAGSSPLDGRMIGHPARG